MQLVNENHRPSKKYMFMNQDFINQWFVDLIVESSDMSMLRPFYLAEKLGLAAEDFNKFAESCESSLLIK